MNDRLLRGTLAGMVAETAAYTINWVARDVLRFARTRWVLMLHRLVYGRPVETPLDWALAVVLCFSVGGALGFVYAAFFQPEPRAGNYYFRAIALGIGFMLFAYVLGNLYRVPTFVGLDARTVATTWVSVTVWGLLTGYLVRRWDKVHKKTSKTKKLPER